MKFGQKELICQLKKLSEQLSELVFTNMQINTVQVRKLKKVKMVLLGNQGCGKTALLGYIVYKQFAQEYSSTVGVDFLSKTYPRGDKNFRIQFWDTAGQQRFLSLLPSYVRDSQIIAILADLSNMDSIMSIEKWFSFCHQCANVPSIKVVFGKYFIQSSGTKSDLVKDETSIEKAKEIATKLQCNFYPVSAKNGSCLSEAIQQIVNMLLNQHYPESASPSPNVKDIKPPELKPSADSLNLVQEAHINSENSELKQRVTTLENKVYELEQKIQQLMSSKDEESKNIGKNFEEVLMIEAYKLALKSCTKLPCPCFKSSKDSLMPKNSYQWKDFGQWAIIHQDTCDSCRQILKEYTLKYLDQKKIN